jgi:hypothetical protein
MTPEEAALVAQVHREDRDVWEREVEAELDPKRRGAHVEVVGGRKYKIGTTGVVFWSGRSTYDPSKYVVGVHPDSEPSAKMYIDLRWLRVIDGCEPSLSEYTSTDEEALAAVQATMDEEERMLRAQLAAAGFPVHKSRGKVIGPEGVPYGTTHDMDCPGCINTPFSASPRSEAYWSA